MKDKLLRLTHAGEKPHTVLLNQVDYDLFRKSMGMSTEREESGWKIKWNTPAGQLEVILSKNTLSPEILYDQHVAPTL